MKIEHTTMVLHLSDREQKLIIDEYQKLRFGDHDRKKPLALDFERACPNIFTLLEHIKTCNQNKAHVVDQDLDLFNQK
jgi:hypothetical protein